MNRIVYATCLGISSANQLAIKNELTNFGVAYDHNLSFKEIKCAELFKEYQRGLSIHT